MTDCTTTYSAVPHPRERRRAWIITSVVASAMIFLASIFGWHPPDPPSCDPESPARFIVTQTATPTVASLCFDPGPKHNFRSLLRHQRGTGKAGMKEAAMSDF